MDAPAKSVAVFYPDIGEPYRRVFLAVIQGIEEQLGGKVFALPTTGQLPSLELEKELLRRDIKALIALGRNGLRQAAAQDKVRPVLGGGVVSLTEDSWRVWPLQSLAPDPAAIFGRLKSLLPQTRRVITIFESKQSDWLVRSAKDGARSFGMELVAVPATDLKSAALAYRDWLSKMDSQRDALWLLQDTVTVDESIILPMVLEECWAKRIVLFSSNLGHVRKGALFALYPDNLMMGRSLGRQLQELMANGVQSATPGLRGLKDLNWALNIRTAGHIGMRADVQRLGADLIFPEP